HRSDPPRAPTRARNARLPPCSSAKARRFQPPTRAAADRGKYPCRIQLLPHEARAAGPHRLAPSGCSLAAGLARLRGASEPFRSAPRAFGPPVPIVAVRPRRSTVAMVQLPVADLLGGTPATTAPPRGPGTAPRAC